MNSTIKPIEPGIGVTMMHDAAYFPGTVLSVEPNNKSEYPSFYFQLDAIEDRNNQGKVFIKQPQGFKLRATWNSKKGMYMVEKMSLTVAVGVREHFVYPGYCC